MLIMIVRRVFPFRYRTSRKIRSMKRKERELFSIIDLRIFQILMKALLSVQIRLSNDLSHQKLNIRKIVENWIKKMEKVIIMELKGFFSHPNINSKLFSKVCKIQRPNWLLSIMKKVTWVWWQAHINLVKIQVESQN